MGRYKSTCLRVPCCCVSFQFAESMEVAMPSLESGGESAVRGLATVAMLKVNFDSGKDHLSMFEPFVIDTICSGSSDVINVTEIRKQIAQRHQLLLPIHTLRALLDRSRKQGFLKREGGQYFADVPPVFSRHI